MVTSSNVKCEIEPASASANPTRRPKIGCEVELLLCRLIDEEYTRHPFLGSRKMIPFYWGRATGSTESGCSA